jgi:DNA-directed RNA polymerase subunit omega
MAVLPRNTLMNPPIEDLLDKVDSKFTLVALSSKRARQINSYYNQLGEGMGVVVPPQVTSVSGKPLTISFEEIAAGKATFHRPEPGEEDGTEGVPGLEGLTELTELTDPDGAAGAAASTDIVDVDILAVPDPAPAEVTDAVADAVADAVDVAVAQVVDAADGADVEVGAGADDGPEPPADQ